MDDVIALRVVLDDGSSRYFLTWGRLSDAIDTGTVEEIVRAALSRFSLGGRAASVTVCESLREAATAQYFYENFFRMSQERIPYGPGYQQWAESKLRDLRAGREIYYLGENSDPSAKSSQ